MNKFLHHICWYVGLGPFIPLPLILFFPGGGSITRLLGQLPEILSLTWIVAALPALLSGVFMAILSGQVYRIWFWRLLTGGIAGVVITVICCGIIGAFIPMLFYVLPLLIVSALLSGIVMGLIIPWLPPRVAPRQ